MTSNKTPPPSRFAEAGVETLAEIIQTSNTPLTIGVFGT